MTLLVYGVMRAQDCPTELEAVEHDGLRALVGETPEGDMRVRRETLLAQTDALARAIEAGPVVPLRFGAAFADADAVVEELLAPRGADLRARLDALEGKVEMQLKATFVEDAALRDVLAGDAAVAQLAARVRGMPAAASHFESIRLGELIGQAVEARAEGVANDLVAALEPFAVATAIGRRQHQWMALNASFLVETTRRPDFEAVVDGLGESYAGRLQLTLIGPLAPHSFADDLEGAAWA